MMRIQYEAKKVERDGKPEFWRADPPKFRCDIDLSEVKISVFPSRKKDGDLTIIIDDKKDPQVQPQYSDKEEE